MEINRIAVAVGKDGHMYADHFGMAPLYHIYDLEGQFIEQRDNPHGEGGAEQKEHGGPRQTLDMLDDCLVFLAKVTGHYLNQVTRTGVTVVVVQTDDPAEAVRDYLAALPG